MAPPRPASPLVRRHLLTLGADPPRMVDPDEPGVALLGPSKPLALLVYLASRASRSATRDHLVDLLWADRERAKALQSLRQTLIEVRKRVGEGVVHARDDALVLDDGVTFDVVAFERAIAEKAYAAAAALWAGDFFPGFAAPGGREFERWLDGERQRIRRQFLHVAAEQVRATMGGPHAREAVALARRARDAEPLDEGAWRLVVQSLVAARDVVGARAEADACERMAAVEGIDLSMATHDALRAARRDEEAAADARAREAHGGIEVRELVGRAREFAALLADWERARAGHGGHVHLTAPAGLGKTRLLQDLRARLRATRARVVTVRAARGERALPYAFAAHVAARLGTWRGAAGVAPGTLRVLSALSPGLADPGARASTPSLDVDSDAVLVQRALALAELVAAVSAEAPVALLLDDMHWADDASRVVFGMLASQARDHPILVVTAARPPLPIALEDGARLVDLTPLGVDDVWSFVAAVHELPDAPWVSTCIEQLAHVTGGSPLLLLETLQLLHDRGRLTVVDDRWHCPDEGALLAELRGGRALDRRVDALEPAARTLLLVLAVEGVAVTKSLLRAALAGLPTFGRPRGEEGFEPLLLRLEDMGLVSRLPAAGDGEVDRWQVAHDEIAASVVDRSVADDRRAAHRALARAHVDIIGDRRAEGGAHGERRGALRRAAEHARTSADDATLMVIARRWVDGRRHAGDARDVRSLVRELLGDRVSQGEVEQVVRRLPVAVRMGPVGMRRAMVGMIGVIAMTVLAAAPSVLRRPPDVELFVLGDSAVHRVAFRAAEWRASDREVLRSTAMTDDRELRALAGASFAESRPTGGWVATRDYAGGSSELDLVLPDGQRQRLTESTSDDLYASAGPDGRIAFLTTRFDPDDHTDVALLDPVTGRVVPLTRTPDWEGSPKWSPDGTRIAFVRRGVEGDPRAPLCTIGVDGAGERCVEPSSGLATRVEAWTADDAVAVTLDRDGVEELAVVDLSSGAVRTVHAGGQQYTVSPDGAWFATSVVLASTMRARWVIGDMRQGEAVREVDLPSSTSVPIWRVARTGERALARVSIDGADRPLAVDVPQRMAVSGTDALGRTVVLHDVRWSVSDTAVATIDGAGMLTPRRAGGVRVRATVGGWRSAEVLLRIAASPRELVVDEQWSAPSRAGWAGVGWRLWGVPRPRVVSGEGGAPALLIDGDGNHHSGAYLDRALDASRGVSMEVRLSLPVSRLQWQTITVGFTALPDSAARATWDHGDARPTAFGAASSRANCEVRLPAAEGALGVGRVVAHVDTRTSPRIAVPATLFDGRWFTVRVSLLPDGRCSMAIDGRVVWTSENAVDRRVPVHAVVHGQSVGTAVKVGRVVVSRGGTTAAGGKELHFR